MMLKEFQPQGFDVFAGSETILLDTLRGGGAGCITATGNVNPSAILRLYREWQSDGADAQQAALNRTRAAFQAFPLIAAMKAVLADKSGDAGWSHLRPPLVELDAQQSRQLVRTLDDLGFEVPRAHELADTTEKSYA